MRFPKQDNSFLEGKLLVASTRMGDPRFAQSVILVLHHDDEGAMGIVLNKPLGEKPSENLQKLIGFESAPRDFYAGGPVSGPVIAIALSQEKSEEFPQAGSVVVIKEPKQLEQLKKIPQQNLLVFIGHAGWKAGQLETEIGDGAWHPIPARLELLFGHEREAMWLAAIREVGREFYRTVLGIQEFPEDTAAN